MKKSLFPFLIASILLLVSGCSNAQSEDAAPLGPQATEDTGISTAMPSDETAALSETPGDAADARVSTDTSGEPTEDPSGDPSAEPQAVAGYIVVRGFEWGPGVNKLIVELNTTVDDVYTDDTSFFVTRHNERTVTDAYRSDELGNRVKHASRYVAFELETSFESTGSPFEMDMSTEHNVWADEYFVAARFTVEKNGTAYPVMLLDDCMDHLLCPELERFSVRGRHSGEYENPLSGEREEITLNWAAYEPEAIRSWEKNPLIVWLHGRGEGGDDISKVILGNEVSALTEKPIQDHFKAGDQTGAYVLVVQSPTYWLDPGDGTEGLGDQPSRYTQALMETIFSYTAQNPDVDADRIYLIGASNGGFMTLELIINYPGFFAAAVPCSAAYSYYVYDWEQIASSEPSNGPVSDFGISYPRTDEVHITEDELALLSATPLWFVDALTDTLVPALEYSVPLYHSLLEAGAQNCWYTLYFIVSGTDSPDTMYLGHWAWVYILNDEVEYVQDASAVRDSDDPYLRGLMPADEGGFLHASDENGEYQSLFDWLNAQIRG